MMVSDVAAGATGADATSAPLAISLLALTATAASGISHSSTFAQQAATPSPTPASAPAEAKPEQQGSDAAKKDEAKPADPAVLKEGHSVHGEIFNEGPRQAAYLMSGVGRVRFPTTSTNEDAKKFVEQGVAQLHGSGTSKQSDRSVRPRCWTPTARLRTGAWRCPIAAMQREQRALSLRP